MKTKPWEQNKFFYSERQKKDKKFDEEFKTMLEDAVKKSYEDMIKYLENKVKEIEDNAIVKLWCNGKELYCKQKEINEKVKEITELEYKKFNSELPKKEEVKENKKVKI